MAIPQWNSLVYADNVLATVIIFETLLLTYTNIVESGMLASECISIVTRATVYMLYTVLKNVNIGLYVEIIEITHMHVSDK